MLLTVNARGPISDLTELVFSDFFVRVPYSLDNFFFLHFKHIITGAGLYMMIQKFPVTISKYPLHVLKRSSTKPGYKMTQPKSSSSSTTIKIPFNVDSST